MRVEFKEVPYRRWGSGGGYLGRLVDCKEGRKLMDRMGKEMAAGHAVDFRQSAPIAADALPGALYDTISLTITD